VDIAADAFFPASMASMVAAARARSDWVSALDATIKSFSFNTFLYGFSTVSRPSCESRMWTFSTLPMHWVRRYEMKAYIEVDPRIQRLFLSPLPVIWDQSERGKSVRVDEFLEEAGSVGTCSGISFYFPDSGDFNYMVAFNSPVRFVNASTRSDWMNRQGELMMFAIYFHALFMKPLILKGLAPSSQGTPLSPRELETLGLVVQGLRHDDIAKRMGITPRTVQSHTDSIRSKLNANNISEAVFLATKAGLLAGSKPVVTSR
jgi:DNA-binding CsgD family transcriptional regulator